MAVKRSDDIYPQIGNALWADRLADAIENTCADHEVVPPPRQAILEGLAAALPDTEIKALIATQRGRKVLKPNAYRIVQAGDEQVLLLTCDVHGAAVVPWDLNDRTAVCWSSPAPEASHRVKDLVAAELALQEATKSAKSAEKERDALRRAPGDDTYAAQALAAATQKHQDTVRRVHELEAEKHALLAALGHRRPRPVVRAIQEAEQPKAALALAEQPYAVAVHMQRYAAENLQRAGKTRGYDLTESLADTGQLSKGMNVLQQWQITHSDGTVSKLWRLAAVTGNNRALARLDVFRVRPEHLVTGMPQSLVPMPKDKKDGPEPLLLSLREILNRLSARLNRDGAKPETEATDPSRRAAKIATVSAEIVIGCTKPEALEHVLRALNVNDHLRGIQPYDEDARLIALFATLVDAYVRECLLADALAEAFPDARGADLLDLVGVRDALTVNGPLDPLEPLVPSGADVSPVVLRDVAVRAITALVFPGIPPEAPQKGNVRTVRDTGRFWPVVRGTLQEPAWSQIRAKAAEGRTRLWSAAVAQLFVRRGNILSALGLFGTTETKEGAGQDPRPLMELLLGAEAGDAAAWTALVQRMAPALIHAPQPFITPGQGSEAGTGRKGVRRTPKSALAALTLAYTAGAPGVSRALLLAFAKAVLEHPDALRPPKADDDTPLVCYGEQHWAESERTAITAGMVIAPDSEGRPTSYVADKAWFDELFPVDLCTQVAASSGSPANAPADAGTTAGSGAPITANGEAAADPRDQLAKLRRELPARIELVEGSYQKAVDAAHTLMTNFEEAHSLRIQLGEEPLPAEQRIEWMEKLSKARAAAQASVTTLEQVEALILKV
ncbi:hypothetical protein LO772_30395 [Yinghuangia sp. ASG 101]|uniref:hypothetical protein n=1 Tax=Yinghuangia sp. ASG 101 TaxID=2896848 RepID=UPI001E28BFA3|nr:hypothetical protein [Yinghuangia sp. ASG 101]UGQ11072.1 hypothetical protein LO772_30395 [Yinghuangia sp. ASG 101]